jgi:hypothetical protein
MSSYSAKRSKSSGVNTKDQPSLTSTALTFFLEPSRNLFIQHLRMPPILFKHQLYAFKPENRTLIDCELQEMFANNQLRLFHSDSGVMLMFTNDYHLLIDRQLNDSDYSSLALEKTRLKQRFTHELLPKCIRLSVDRELLEKEYQFSSNDVHLLIQLGFLLPKDINQYWFSLPNLAAFVTCIEKGRRTLLQMMTRRTYREIPMSELRSRDTKKRSPLGFDYHIYDLIGANAAHLLDTPTGAVVKIGPEKA